MIAKVNSCGILGIDGYIIEVETDISNGLPSFEIVGLADTAVKEAKERVRAAIRNINIDFPIRRITINLAPANTRKEGSSLDLPIAIGILISSFQISISDISSYAFIGELSLDGGVKRVNGVLPMALNCFNKGIKNIILPKENADEAAVISGLNVYPVENLKQVVYHFREQELLNRHTINLNNLFLKKEEFEFDFSDVSGQDNVKRVLEIAAAGGHNVLMIGSPGSGKTMLARRFPSILPDLNFDEAIEITKIHSITGNISSNMSLVTKRPFRSPHHSITDRGLIGGGRFPKPGEISLAHYGVLFLDELPEFSSDTLEVLRQPLEDGVVNISRINGNYTYPAEVTLLLAANPCKCGYFLDKRRDCTCSKRQIQQYFSRISGPLLDRIDLSIEVLSIEYKELENSRKNESSKDIRTRVNKARGIQLNRYKDYKIFSNSQLKGNMLNKFCSLDVQSKKLLNNAFERLSLSARAYSRILKVSRTIADLDGKEKIESNHIAEAIQYRSLDRRLWE